jgi:hypothetical protein
MRTGRFAIQEGLFMKRSRFQTRRTLAPVPSLGSASICLAAALLLPAPAPAQDIVQASALLDISGVSWVEDDFFLAVHDGKANDEERARPRASLLLLPADVPAPPEFARSAAAGLYYRELGIAWPSGESNDLESIARIPGSRKFLFVESGDDCSAFQRIFLASLSTAYEVTIDEVASWPASAGAPCEGVFNVESSAVFMVGTETYFVYAERAEGSAETELRWARMELAPLRFGPFSSARYAVRLKAGPGVRPLVALDVDSSGRVFAATAYDSGEDNGPFRSMVSQIGQFRRQGKKVHFVPSGKFANVARQDGFKIEGVAVRPVTDAPQQVFAGTDDENYGAVLRQVAPVP